MGERIRHILAEVIREATLADPDLAQPELITVTAVDIGPDLKHAQVYVMPLGGKETEKTVAALNRAVGYFRRELGPKLDLRYTPQLTFRADKSFAEAAHIEKLLKSDKVRQDIEKKEE